MERIKRYGFRIYISHLTAVFIVSAAWWGILYPEFGFSADTFSVAEETSGQPGEETDAEAEHELSGAEAFWAMLEARPGQIKIRSKLLEEVFGIRGNDNEQRSTDRDF